MLALGRLLRLSLSPSAAADAACGVLLGANLWPAGGTAWLQILAALCVYHGGMALNDWADRRHDAATRPERPIPSGRISAGFALGLGLTLSLVGPLLSYVAAPAAGWALAVVAFLSVSYNLGVRGPRIGPLLLGACRAGNLIAAFLCGRASVVHDVAQDTVIEAWPLALALAYGLYVFLLSCLARYEDTEAGPLPPTGSVRHPRSLLLYAAVVLALAPWLRTLDPDASLAWVVAAAGVALAGAFGLFQRVHSVVDWNPGAILGSMGMGLRRLLIATGSFAVTQGRYEGLLVALVILAGYPASFALRKLFPPS